MSTLMLGFWVKILGRGTYQGQGADRQRRIYDTTVWKQALHNAFPNVKVNERRLVEMSARRVLAMRNRIAHHEHIVWGVPLPGEIDARGRPLRMSLETAHENLLTLAGSIDRGFEDWLRENSEVGRRIGACPVPDTKLLLREP